MKLINGKTKKKRFNLSGTRSMASKTQEFVFLIIIFYILASDQLQVI